LYLPLAHFAPQAAHFFRGMGRAERRRATPPRDLLLQNRAAPKSRPAKTPLFFFGLSSNFSVQGPSRSPSLDQKRIVEGPSRQGGKAILSKFIYPKPSQSAGSILFASPNC
jgi:hypothetical protein